MKKLNINVIFISIVAIVVSLFFALKKESKEIYVNGRCSKLVNKDKFSISISIKNLEKDSSVALSKTLSSYKQISEYLKEVQKENKDLEIETTEYSTDEKKEWNEKLKSKISLGVEALISIKLITSNPELLTKIAFDLGKFSNVYVSKFNNFVSDSLYEQEVRNCIKDAMLDAKAQAELMAASLNQSIGKMISANYYSGNNVDGAGMLYKASLNEMEAKEDAEPATIFSGSKKINITIDVRFELK